MKDKLEAMLRRQEVLARFGDFSLQSENLDEVLTQACRLVADALGTGRAKVLEISADGESLLVRAGVGWDDGVVGHERLSMREHTSESFSINARAPVISRDIRTEQRFPVPMFMRRAGVVALANVPIFTPGGGAYGLLQVDDIEPRDFDADDTQFLRTYASILGPVIDRLLKVRELRLAEQRLRITAESATDYAIFIADKDDRFTDWLPGAEAVFGWSASEAIGQPGAFLFTPEDRAAGEHIREVAMAGEKGLAPNVRWHLRKDGSRVFIEGSVRALRDTDGKLSGFLKIGQDVTQKRATLDQQKVLLAEVQHRTRNLMAVVRRVADQTLAASQSLDEFGSAFRDRIESLARVQVMLSQLSGHGRVLFDDLIESELAAHVGDNRHAPRIVVEGPKGIALRSSTVQVLAMAIHELCTNALKYGALHQPQATLTIKWHLREDAGEPWIVVDWRESGLNIGSDKLNPARVGSGRALIERALPYQLGARTSFSLEPAGLHCTLEVPVSRSNADSAIGI